MTSYTFIISSIDEAILIFSSQNSSQNFQNSLIVEKFQKNFFETWFLSFCHLLNTFCSGALLLIVFWSYLTCEFKKIYLFKKKYPRDPSLSLKISVWRLNDFLSPIYGVLFYTKMCTLKTKIDIINIFILVLPLR